MIKYAIPKKVKKEKTHINYSNRGMVFEEAINNTNEYYRNIDKALIHKKPTPIHIVKIDNSNNHARICDAYFEQPSTTDYNGIYKGHYIDFEAKETRNKTSFPLRNINEHQVKHLLKVQEMGGISFVLMHFILHDEIYLVDSSLVGKYYYSDKTKSIPYQVIKSKGHKVPYGYLAEIDYLKVVDQVYLNE